LEKGIYDVTGAKPTDSTGHCPARDDGASQYDQTFRDDPFGVPAAHFDAAPDHGVAGEQQDAGRHKHQIGREDQQS
jgi:hypothetical protein